MYLDLPLTQNKSLLNARRSETHRMPFLRIVPIYLPASLRAKQASPITFSREVAGCSIRFSS